MNTSAIFAFCVVLIAGLVFAAVEAQFMGMGGMGGMGLGGGMGGFGRGYGYGFNRGIIIILYIV